MTYAKHDPVLLSISFHPPFVFLDSLILPVIGSREDSYTFSIVRLFISFGFNLMTSYYIVYSKNQISVDSIDNRTQEAHKNVNMQHNREHANAKQKHK